MKDPTEDEFQTALSCGYIDEAISYANDMEVVYHRLLQAVGRILPCAIPEKAIWGYGRPLWDLSNRSDGRKQTRISVLGGSESIRDDLVLKLASHLNIPVFSLKDATSDVSNGKPDCE